MRLRFKALVPVVALATFGLGNVALASGFQLWEQSAAGTGDYHAGGAAEADDASTEFYNPAGMIRLHRPQVSAGGVFIPVSVAFDGTTTGGGITATTNGFAHGDSDNLVPNFHLVYPIIDRKLVFGFGVTVPFGLTTNYSSGDLGVALGGTVTKLMTINFNPSIAYAITPKWSIGLGGDVLYGRATYDSIVDFFGAAASFTNTLSGTAVGWNAGTLYQVSSRVRFGVSYRSKVILHANGRSRVSGRINQASNNLSAKLVLPSTLTVSGFFNVARRWDLLASAYHTQWSAFNTLILNNTALDSITVKENYKNTWNFAVGAHYHYSSNMMFKFGVGYDQTPTRDGFRDVRLPGNNRIAIALGMHDTISKNLGFDCGWVHLFAKKTAVNTSSSSLPFTSIGTATMSADVFGTQLSWTF